MKHSILAVAAFLAASVCVPAQTVVFNVTLNGANEVPTVSTSGSGSGTATLDLGAHTLTFNNITFSGLGSNSTGGHIHGPANTTSEAGVLYSLDGTYFTAGSTTGTISGTLNFVSGTYTISQQETQLQDGLWYINIHTTGNSGGEIRGQLTAVPEPSTTALLMGIAGAVVAWARRRAIVS